MFWGKKKVCKSECICVHMHVNFLSASPLKVEHITHFFAILRSGKLWVNSLTVWLNECSKVQGKYPTCFRYLMDICFEFHDCLFIFFQQEWVSIILDRLCEWFEESIQLVVWQSQNHGSCSKKRTAVRLSLLHALLFQKPVKFRCLIWKTKPK